VSSALAPDRPDLLHALAAGTAGVVGEAFLRSLVRHLGESFEGADVVFVSELLEHRRERARVLASWPDALHLPEGAEYDLEGAPCHFILTRDVVAIPSGTPARFPEDELIVRERLEGYLGVAMHDAAGQTIGYVGVLSRRRLEARAEQLAALQIFAARAGAEVCRRRAEAQLREREAEVAASRTRVVQAADEERRRIGRDIHDGVQQRLVVLTQRLDLARRALAEDPDRATAMLAEAREHAAAAGQELREIAHGLHPAGLTERGLDGALRLLGARSPLPLQLKALPGRRLPDTVEVTVYYLVSEAISNAVKHAQATSLSVEVQLRGRTLQVVVADDGVGGADRDGGSGLRGLGDRVGALGGKLAVVSPPGEGTRLLAEIPLGPFRHRREPILEFGHDTDDGLGERLIAAVLAGEKTATVSLSREWDLEGGPPHIGQRLPVMDHHGDPRGTVEVTRVAVLPFALIDEEAVRAESAGTSTVEEWRETQWRFYEGCRDEIAVLLGEPGWRLTEAEPMVITWFRLA
jgi:signal transduction histidine kinase/uncharacterized protein YhfF